MSRKRVAAVSHHDREVAELRADRELAVEHLKIAMVSLDDPNDRAACLRAVGMRPSVEPAQTNLSCAALLIDILGVIVYIRLVDVRFGADRLRKAYEDEKARTKEWGQVVARLYVRRIDTLYAAENAQTLRALQALRFHALTGQRKGQYAVDLGPAYRLILTFQDRAMTVVQVEEVSKHYDD